MRKFGLAWAALLVLLATPAAAAKDRHAGYYYPTPTTTETYGARTIKLPEATRETRLAFIIGITKKSLSRPYPPRIAIFAKGDEAQKLIIVALEDDYIDTLYRARALLAMLTSVTRTTPFIVDLGLADFLTFFDLAKLLGFEQITISDGDKFTHQVILQ
jgi:hypothetical protein